MADSNDCLNQELQEIDKVLRKEANKKKELSELKHEIEEIHENQKSTKGSQKDSHDNLEEQLRHNLHDQISLMNVDQMAEVHNWLKHSDIDDIERM
ncbi:unnamed protein product [Caenorhabditis brenneri]